MSERHNNTGQRRADACVTNVDTGCMFDIEVFGTEDEFDELTIRLYAWRGKCRPETVIRFAGVCCDLYGDAVELKTGTGKAVEL